MDSIQDNPITQVSIQEDKFSQLAFDLAMVGMAVINQDGVLLRVNAAFSAFTGYNDSELVGKSSLDILRPDDMDIVMAACERALRGEACSFRHELRYLRKDGRQIWGEINASLVHDEHGVPVHFFTQVLDITQRKQLEVAQRTNEHYQRALLDNFPFMVWLKDAESRFIAVNQPFADACGLASTEELIGKTDLDVWPQDLAERYRTDDSEVLRTGQKKWVEEPIEHQGVRKWFETYKAPVDDVDGKPCGTVGFARDITERKQHEELLWQQIELETRLTKIAEVAPGVIYSYLLRPDGTACMPYASPRLWEVVGVRPEDAAQDASLPSFSIHPDDMDRVAELTAESARTLRPWHYEYRILHPLKGEIWIEGRSTPEPQLDGSTLWHGFLHDITERKQAEKHLAQVNCALGHMREALYLTEDCGRFTYVNEESCRMLGYSRDELLNLSVADIVADFTPEFWSEHSRELETHGSHIFELHHRTKDGRTIPVEVNVNRFQYEGGCYRLALVRDITERKRAAELLHASEQVFRALVENSPDNIARYDLECRRIYINPAIEKQFGLPMQDVLGKTPMELSSLPEPVVYEEMVRAVRESGLEIQTEIPFRTAEGEPRWAHIRVVPEFGPDGKVVSILAIGRDISALKESELRLRTLVENFPDFIVGFDTEGRFTYVNPSVTKACGLPAEHFIGKTAHDLDPGTGEPLLESIRQAVKQGAPNSMEVKWRMLDGEHCFEIRQIPEKDENGRVIGVLGIARDVTERKKAEDLLHKHEQEFRTLVENSPDIVVRYDRECRGIYINPAFEKVNGVPISQALNKTPAEFLKATMPAEDYMDKLRQVMESGQETEFTLEVYKADDGPSTYHLTRMVPEYDQHGEIASVLGILRNITVLKETERCLEESQHLLRLLAARSETIREEERRHLTREIHDELGQYLMALRMGISVVDIQFGESNPPLQEKTRHLVELVDSTIQVVRNLVASLRPAALDMGIVSALEWLAEEFSGHTGIQCELTAREENIHLDEKRTMAIFRIAQESLTNVGRHAQASKVELALERRDGHCFLQVRDNGKGFDPAIRKKQSFGLVGIRERVLMLGGEADISSAPGCGTVINVRIPLHNISVGQ